MNDSHGPGWSRLLQGATDFRGEGRFVVPAYSEFMPGPWVGRRPYGSDDGLVCPPPDEHGFAISEYQQAHHIRPGLGRIAAHLMETIRKHVAGEHTLSKALQTDNAYVPKVLLDAGLLPHERHVILLGLALSLTLDDKGRVRWTLFGSSDEGPGRAFWKGFMRAPGEELGEAEGFALLRDILLRGAGVSPASLGDLRGAGFRILPAGPDPDFARWAEEPIPGWARRWFLDEAEPVSAVKWLLTFRPFARLPEPLQRAYLTGRLQLLPTPRSLAFFGHPGYRKLSKELDTAMQIPLLHLFPRDRAATDGIRITQSGWLDEPHPPHLLTKAPPHTYTHGPLVNHIKRTSRWNRIARDEDEMALLDTAADKVTSVLFSSHPDHIGLYGKPMARNAQVWTHDHCLLLDGPRHGHHRIEAAARVVSGGGRFGYRMLYPPMRIGHHAIYWHLPLCAVAANETGGEHQAPLMLEGPKGFLSARPMQGDGFDDSAVELWPRLLAREAHLDAAELYEHDPGRRHHQTSYNVRKILEAHEVLGEPLTRSLARRLLTVSKGCTLTEWYEHLTDCANDRERGARLVSVIKKIISADEDISDQSGGASLTFDKTSSREFEVRYWHQVAALAEGEFIAKDNADFSVREGPGSPLPPLPLPAAAAHDLERLGTYLHERYLALIEKHHMGGKVSAAVVGDHRFRWRTDFDFPWMGGWARNQTGHARERNIVMVIPGNNRREAIVMGDHYDTAYMEDVYETERGGDLTRRAAAGADDNHSSTTALLMAADVLLPLSLAGKLERDVWLVHLTGEEFPADCLGARNLVERLVEGGFGIVSNAGQWVDLSQTRVVGAFVLDMVAHNNDHERYVFQIAHGEGADSARLAYLAHRANEQWNKATELWNAKPARKHPGPSERVPSGATVPPEVAHARLDGEIRPSWHFKSSLYNTDGQIFSDAGIPVVLFMENYDINRSGYHDTKDTMANIDLDYAAALVAIAIETVAQAATVPGKQSLKQSP